MKENDIIRIIIKYLTKFPTVIKDGLWLRTIKSDQQQCPALSIVKGNTLDILADMIEKNELIIWYHANTNDPFFHATNEANSFIEPLEDGRSITYPWTMKVDNGLLVMDEPCQVPRKAYLDSIKTPEGFFYAARLLLGVEETQGLDKCFPVRTTTAYQMISPE